MRKVCRKSNLLDVIGEVATIFKGAQTGTVLLLPSSPI